MARKGRETSRTGMYHVILRGHDGLFFSGNDYEEFLNILSLAENVKLYAYSLEKNKVHLAFYTDGSISAVLKSACTRYARYVNRTYNKTGRLFYDRYVSLPIDDDKSLERIVCFISNKPTVTSLDEYKGNAKICTTDRVSTDSVINPSVIVPCTDDYASMSDRELKKLILTLFGKKNSSISKDEFKEIVKLSTQYSNLTKTRLSRLFGVKPEYKTENKSEKVKEVPKKKEELSVWLL